MQAFDQSCISRALAGWVPEVRFLPQVASTNPVAMRWAQQGAGDLALVVADHQTEGRGRLNRRWFAPPGTCLLFSLVMRPHLDPAEFGLLGLATGVAVCRALSIQRLSPQLKWPNDVLLGHRKTAGILSETDGSSVVIMGVGINVNVASLPPEAGSAATSMALEAGHEFDRLDTLRLVIEALAPLSRKGAREIRDAYLPWCGTLGMEVLVELAGQTITGRAVDVSASGALVLEGGRTIESADVVHLRADAKEA
jgi:BirA family biotin operon repressor/biotin-[acetyl-CoA-carboxylase] ligase